MKNTVKLVNFTPHIINILNKEGETLLNVLPFGSVARVETREIYSGDMHVGTCNIPITERYAGRLIGLPCEVEDTIYIVSSMVACHKDAIDRADLMVPGPLVRDAKGRPIGCLGLAHVS